ncbi:serine hydrolase domain-containing protein [Actinomadura chibensis]|uniref:Beta-lactamase family protein n=1 Tax=Actinomadura chibensis TaxID=392828 RepID=A0A5D0NQ30_9ACTN|nr:serine hydrolase domain-containing protein [Actinomadura chibensis]TYB46419.1 beta-lactamase family protein [Actinomadura chibensis]
MSRRAVAALTAGALLAGLLPSAAAAAQPGRGGLQGDVDAIRATGATGVLAEVLTASGAEAARAGVADLRTGRPVPWNSYFHVGSDTKTYTSVVALQLVGEGKLRLTDTVEKWLPGVVRGKGNDGRRITVKNLLRHTSGLNDYVAVQLGDGGDFTPEKYRENRFRVSTPEAKVAAAMTEPPLWVPDMSNPAEETHWGYSNTNYVLAGLIIEKVTGHPWEQEVHDRVIEPLGLRHTITPGTSAYVPQPSATAYTRFPGREELTDTSISVSGGADGAIISTPRDHATFLRALLGGRLLAPAQLAQMKETVPADDWILADGVRYGLGLAWRPVRGCAGGVWFHGGTFFGVISESGVSADGRRAASAAVSTYRPGDPAQDDQDRASLRLVDRAVCGAG